MLKPDFTFYHVATIRPWLRRGVSQDEYGDPYSVKCRVNLGRRYAATGSSTTATVVAAGNAFLPANAVVKEKDQFIFGKRVYTVSYCQPCYDMSGAVNHIEVDLQ